MCIGRSEGTIMYYLINVFHNRYNVLRRKQTVEKNVKAIFVRWFMDALYWLYANSFNLYKFILFTLNFII